MPTLWSEFSSIQYVRISTVVPSRTLAFHGAVKTSHTVRLRYIIRSSRNYSVMHEATSPIVKITMSHPHGATTSARTRPLLRILVSVIALLSSIIAAALPFSRANEPRGGGRSSNGSVPERWPYESGGLISNRRTGRSVLLMAQTVGGNEMEIYGTLRLMNESAEYLRNVVLTDDIFEGVYGECVNRHRLCSFWASIDLCTQNPHYMVRDKFCLLACQQCDELTAKPTGAGFDMGLSFDESDSTEYDGCVGRGMDSCKSEVPEISMECTRPSMMMTRKLPTSEALNIQNTQHKRREQEECDPLGYDRCWEKNCSNIYDSVHQPDIPVRQQEWEKQHL